MLVARTTGEQDVFVCARDAIRASLFRSLIRFKVRKLTIK